MSLLSGEVGVVDKKSKFPALERNFKNTNLRVSAYIGDICLQTKQRESAAAGVFYFYFFTFWPLCF